jgi:lysophospholipase L1-like esterase
VEHELKLRVAAAIPDGSTGKHVRIANLLVNGTIVSEDPFKGMTALQRIDAMYASLEPVTYVPPTDRWTHIPKTMQKLEHGPALTIVVLGDSIINDTCGSNFELLIGRMYPRCEVKRVTSVRSSTGCDWYKQENRVAEYVLKHQPDMLLIGGISNRGTDPADAAESVREVIRQVRAARPETEFLLMTGPFGLEQDPKRVKGWREFVTPGGTDYRSRLMKVAQEENAEFIDKNGIVGRYLLDSKYPYGSFQRDPIHANWRGKQLLGRILEKYFAPK